MNKADLTGMKFGKLTALRPSERRSKDKSVFWIFQCECGNIVERIGARVAGSWNEGVHQSCNQGKCRNETQKTDLTGMKFGKLTAIRPVDERYIDGSTSWVFQCECGAILERSGTKVVQAFRKGKYVSCNRYECNHKYTIPAARNALISSYINGAQRRGYGFSLSVEQCEALFNGDCFYCGAHPSNQKSIKYHSYTYNGIDRWDNKFGYVPGNVVSCCAACNRAKRDMPASEFIALAHRIASRHPKA